MAARKSIAAETILYFLLTVGGIIIIFPILWALFTSFKPTREMFKLPIALLPKTITTEHYISLARSFPLLRLLFNTFVYAGVVAVSSVFFSTIIGYGFSKFRNRITDILFAILLTGIMVPFFARLIPLYLMMVRLGGANTYWGLILPNYLSIFGIFFMKQYATTIPDELIQATRIDGASELQILFRIIFPLMKSAGFTLGAIKFIWTWNDFLWPLVMLSKQETMTMPIAIATFVDPTTISRYGPIMAGAIVMLIPVVLLFLFLQKQIVQGIVMSGFKA